jgi:hypothetical protein
MLQKLLKGDTAVWRGVRTAVQAVIGFLTGLAATVWAVPGVPQAVQNYLSGHVIQLLVGFGLSTGLAAFVWNAIRKDVKTF